jgi:signal transduction histidine kinase
MFGLRQKLALGFGGLLAITLLIGVYSILKITDLGQSIDVILRENYRSVIACQEMKEALERVDSGVLFTLLGYEKEGNELITGNVGKFEKALRVEGNNITVPGEGDVYNKLDTLYTQYKSVLQDVQNNMAPVESRRTVYFTKLLPLFQEVKSAANYILQINQQNMSNANTAARQMAAQARQHMYLLLLSGTGIAIAFMFLAGRWILRPITRLIESANEIRQGNLDLVVTNESADEIGQLSRAFNAMAAGLREFRRSSHAKMIRIQRATQQAFNSLPDAIAVIDLSGNVEMVTATASSTFGLKPNTLLKDLPYPRVVLLCDEAMLTGRVMEGEDEHALIQQFVQGQERFFRPKAIPIPDDEAQPAGVILLLQDVTQLQQQDELKRGLISTVSHQLKSPLTSIRMAIYLLLDEKVGTLAPKQEELLLAAREDSDRLHRIIEDLLDISRIQSGRMEMECRTVTPDLMVLEAAEPFKSAAQDRGVLFATELPHDLPEVSADPTRINHVFANLFSNALKYTSPGGTITVSARADEESVWFSVADTGKGIPDQYLPRVFDQFFRVPEQGPTTGAGLGLAIAKEIVDAHGGVMRVESREGRGSMFSFSLRRADRMAAKERLP